LGSADAALRTNPQDSEALTVKGMLLRLQAAGELDEARRSSLLAEADALRERAIRVQKDRLAGLGTTELSEETEGTE
jgi:hypothetical protein